MTATWAAIIGGVVAALVTAVASVLVAKLNNGRARSDSITAPYAVLADDVVALRKGQREDRRSIEALHDRMALLIDQRDDLLDYIRKLITTWPGPPAEPPPPPPQRLAIALEEHASDRIVETTVTTSRRVIPVGPGEEEDD